MAHPGVKNITLDSNGAGQGEIAPNQLGLFWRFYQASVDVNEESVLTTGGAVLTVQIQINGLPCTSLCTGATPLTASGDPSIDVGGHETLTVIISGGPPGAPVVVTYFYDEIAGVS